MTDAHPEPGPGAETRRMSIEELVCGDERRLLLTGEVDLLGSSDLEAAIRRVCREGSGAVAIDLSGVTFMDSTGLRAVLSASRLCREHDLRLRLIPGPREVQSLFEMTGLLGRLPFDLPGGEEPGPGESRVLPKLFGADDPTSGP